ncbi:MAG: hypothetical protein K2K23_11565, partial [Muribaculaceae bacterium]|nr:hypothetical protein [Muribaculaceae bacterium]
EKGTLLFGTYKLGLYSYNESVNKFHSKGIPGLEKRPDVNCMVTSPDGSVWIGTDNSGLWRWLPASNRYDYIGDATENAPYAITALAASAEGDIFIGKFAKGLYCYKEGKVMQHKTDSEIDRSYVWSMDFDKKGTLWIGTLGNGVFKYDLKKGSIEHFTNVNSLLKSDYILSILPSKDGNVYIGSSGGVCCYDSAARELTDVSLDDDRSLSDSKIMQIIEDSRGLLWISTTSGLKVLDRKKGKVYNIPNGASSYGAEVLGIIEDNNGGIWISNSSRLSNFKVNYDDASGSLNVTKMEYDRKSGLPECDFNQRSFAKLMDGSIAVGYPFGIIHFNPNDIRMNVSKPKVIFTD